MAAAPAAVATTERTAAAEPVSKLTTSSSEPRRRRNVSQLAEQLVPIGDRMLLPDFRGLTQSEVRQITANSELGVKMTGRGRAVAQEPPAGTIVGAAQALVFIHFEDAEPTEPAGES